MAIIGWATADSWARILGNGRVKNTTRVTLSLLHKRYYDCVPNQTLMGYRTFTVFFLLNKSGQGYNQFVYFRTRYGFIVILENDRYNSVNGLYQ